MISLHVLLIILAVFGSGSIKSRLASSSSEVVKPLDEVPPVEIKEPSSKGFPPPICSYQEGPDSWTAKGKNVGIAKKSLIKHLSAIGIKIEEKNIFCSAFCISYEDNLDCPADYNPTICVYKGVNYYGPNSCGTVDQVHSSFCQGADKVLDWRRDVKCEDEYQR